MPERPGLLINRAGAVAWCTEKRGMPSLPCAMGGSCWLGTTAFAARRGSPVCQLMGNWKLRKGGKWLVLHRERGMGIGKGMGMALIIGGSRDSTNNCAAT
jgi:hypothetical protein